MKDDKDLVIKRFQEELVNSLKSDSELNRVINTEPKTRLLSVTRLVLSKLMYRFIFDSRFDVSTFLGGVVTADGPYIEEYRSATKWYQEAKLDEWSTSFTDSSKVKNLNAWFLKNENDSHKYVIVAHGYRMNGLLMGAWSKIYYDLGFNILTPDARSLGKSQGTQITFGWKDKDDYRNWANKIVEMDPDAKIVITGVSMGGGTTMMTCGVDDMPENVRLYIEDCGYSGIDELFSFLMPIVQETFNQYLNPFGINMTDSDMLEIYQSVNKKLQSIQGFSFEDASALKQLKKNKKPILFIHGDSDNFVPTDMVHDCYRATDSEKDLWIVPDTAHGTAIINDLPEYQQRVKAFINKYLI